MQNTTSALSVTRWISGLKLGDERAISLLWEYLNRRMVNLARTKVSPTVRATYDEEDVALSAFDALCTAMRDGRYVEVVDRDQLWRLLAVFVLNKARDRNIHENRFRRGGGVKKFDVDEFIGSIQCEGYSPEEELAMREDCEALLKSLRKPEVQAVALLKLEGFTNEEIGQQLGCTRRAVQRRLAIIRDLWTDHATETLSYREIPR
ncbi:MAG: ECF-type sigma factor [Planctomycetota bacterium]